MPLLLTTTIYILFSPLTCTYQTVELLRENSGKQMWTQTRVTPWYQEECNGSCLQGDGYVLELLSRKKKNRGYFSLKTSTLSTQSLWVSLSLSFFVCLFWVNKRHKACPLVFRLDQFSLLQFIGLSRSEVTLHTTKTQRVLKSTCVKRQKRVMRWPTQMRENTGS